MKLYNTLTRKVETLQPLDGKKISMYSCGPTVYDYPHIGNWYTFIRYDLLTRALRASGYDVAWVMNITDVGHLTSDEDEGEDKLEKGARREDSTAWDVAKKYTDYFVQSMKRLNIAKPDRLPKATDHIPEQIALIQRLEENGHTYTIDDGVYFDTSTFPEYGKMARLDLEHQQEGTRVTTNEQKRNPSDFALWKFSPKGSQRDMEWESPWGLGFPGWHIECSAMSMKYLGETLDIHGGGIDHIPVHHTNEIAQSEGATGKPFSRYWFHSNFNLIDGKKMAKSASNFFTLEDLETKGFSLKDFRLIVLQSHYRTEAHFSWDNLQAAHNRLKRWQAGVDARWQPIDVSSSDGKQAKQIDKIADQLLDAVQDDLNTPLLVSIIDELFDIVADGVERDSLESFIKTLQLVDQLTGLKLQADSDDITSEQKSMLDKRQKAKNSKDYATADHLREALQAGGIEIRDTSNGQIWSRL